MTPNIVVILTKTTAPTAAAGTGDISLIFDRKIDETTIGIPEEPWKSFENGYP